MNLNSEHFRSMIFYDFRSGLSQQQCFDRLIAAFGEEAPAKSTVYKWFQEFRLGRNFLCDEPHTGRPKSAVLPKYIDAVRELILQDRHITYREIQASLGISKTSIQTILHEHLSVRKLCARWIPHKLTEAQKMDRVNWCQEMINKYKNGKSKNVYDIVTGDESWIYEYEPERKCQSTVWVFQFENAPTKILQTRSVGKKMVACFFRKTGHIATVPLEDRRTVNSEWYTTICLPEIFGEIRKTNPNKQIVLHHDNASSHKSKQTSDYLYRENIKLMGHPPYSPDLVPNDFFLIPHVKEK